MNMEESTISAIISNLHEIESELESRLHSSLSNLQDHFRSLWHSIDAEEEKFLAIVKRYTTEEQYETTRETAKMSIHELSEDHQRQIYELDVVFEDLSRKNTEKNNDTFFSFLYKLFFISCFGPLKDIKTYLKG